MTAPVLAPPPVRTVKFRAGLAKVGRVYHYKFVIKGREYYGSTRCELRAGAAGLGRGVEVLRKGEGTLMPGT